jgi:hypothetical protein
MNKLVFSFTLAFLMLIIPNTVAQTLDHVLERHFSASGQEQLSRISTVRLSGKAVQMGMELPYMQIQKRPNLMYMELEIQGTTMKQAFDGKEGWSVEPWMSPAPRELIGPELGNLKRMADIDSELVNWQEKGHELELAGIEPSDAGGYFKLRLSKEGGEVYHYYIDTGSYLLHKMVTSSNFEGNVVDGETIMSDFRDVNGISVPFRVEMRYGGRILMTNIITKVEFDVMIDEDFFSMPRE